MSIKMIPSLIHDSVSSLLNKDSIKPISDLITFGKDRPVKYQKELKEAPGLYAFWLYNSGGLAKKLTRKLAISGPSKTLEEVEWDWHLEADKILLYVGKSTNIKNRISMHLKLGTKKFDSTPNNTLNKVTTSCQVRAGIEHLIKRTDYENISFDFMNNFIGLSIVELANCQDRFFAEDLAIGKGMPWFNLDSER